MSFVEAVEVVKEYDFNTSTSGFIQEQLGVYAAATGVSNCLIRCNTTTHLFRRAFFQFKTTDIPQEAIITKVEIKRVEWQIITPPPSDYTTLRIGTWIGNSLDANAADYSGGNDTFADILTVPNLSYMDIAASGGGADPLYYLNKGGNTDISIEDTSFRPVGFTNYQFNNTVTKNNVTLRVTYVKLRRVAGSGKNGYIV